MAAHAPHSPASSQVTPPSGAPAPGRVTRPSRAQPPALDGYPDIPLFNTNAVVRQTGAPAPTLRAWERRYGILTPRRGQNGYRLYSERDIATVAWLRERVDTGLTISQAIALLRSLDARHPLLAPRRAASPAVAPAMPQEPVTSQVAESPGGLAFERLTDELVANFAALEEVEAGQIIARALAVYGVEEVCLRLFTPALARIGDQWRAGTLSVTVEHFATTVIRAQLDTLYRAALAGQTGPQALVGCAPGEPHELGALTLALFLRRAGMRVIYLGQSVEIEGLVAAARAIHPAWALLSATTRESAESLLALLAAIEQRARRETSSLEGMAPLAGGPAFARDPELARRAGTAWLDGDAAHAVAVLRAAGSRA